MAWRYQPRGPSARKVAGHPSSRRQVPRQRLRGTAAAVPARWSGPVGGCGPNRVGRAVAAGRRWGRTAWYGSGWPPSPRARSSSMLTSRATSCSTRIYRRWSSTCPPTGVPRASPRAPSSRAPSYERAPATSCSSPCSGSPMTRSFSCARCSSARSPTCCTDPTRSRPSSPAPASQRWNSRFASRGLTSPFLTTPPAQPARPAGKQASPGRAASPSRLRILLGVSRR